MNVRGCAGRTRLAGVLLLSGLSLGAQALATVDDKTGLPAGSVLDEDAIESPREVFHSQAIRGRKSYLSNLGNLAFNSPYILGDAARKAHLSCSSCHVNGASNPKFFIPGLSTRPGNFDTTSAFFNPETDNGVLDPLTIPSLRGARFLAPYGHDGRTASLRDFVRNVIVNEFAGPPHRGHRFPSQSRPGRRGAPPPRRKPVPAARGSVVRQALPARSEP
jgi:hypothetical protein